jgi:transcriptional regulator with XRE-family HTH domain
VLFRIKDLPLESLFDIKSILRVEGMSILKISIRQIKAARSLLGWSQDDLAAHSGVSKPTIGRLEAIDSDDPVGGRPETVEALVTALEKAGIEFVHENGGGAGVRLAKRIRRRK